MADQVEDVVVWGNRRPAGGTGGYGGGSNGGAKGEDPGEEQQTDDPEDPNPEQQVYYPCNTPEKRFEKKVDAAAAELFKGLKAFAAAQHPNELGINDREYGAAMWELPSGAIVFGPMTFGPYFTPGGANTVTINWTSPAPGAVLIGMLHTHPINFPSPSGSNFEVDDQGNLTHVMTERANAGANPDLGRIYIGWNEGYNGTAPGATKLNIYNKYNRQAAIGGTLGPEVDPDGVACPT